MPRGEQTTGGDRRGAKANAGTRPHSWLSSGFDSRPAHMNQQLVKWLLRRLADGEIVGLSLTDEERRILAARARVEAANETDSRYWHLDLAERQRRHARWWQIADTLHSNPYQE